MKSVIYAILVVVAIAIALGPSPEVQASPLDDARAESDNSYPRNEGANTCASFARAKEKGLLFDYVIITNRSGGDSLSAPYGQTTVPAMVNVYGRDCDRDAFVKGQIEKENQYSVTTTYHVDQGILGTQVDKHDNGWAIVHGRQETFKKRNVTLFIGNRIGTNRYNTIVTNTWAWHRTDGYNGFIESPNSQWTLTINRYHQWSVPASTQHPIGGNQVGDSIRFRHQLTKTGISPRHLAVNYRTYLVRVPGPAGSQPSKTTILQRYHANNTRREAKTDYPAIPANNDTTILPYSQFDAGNNNHPSIRHTITPQDGGNWICGYISRSPRAHGEGGGTSGWPESGTTDAQRAAASDPKCRYVPYRYNLTPNTTLTNDVVDAGQPVTIDGTINNDGPTVSAGTDVRYVRVVNPIRKSGGQGTGNSLKDRSCAHYDSRDDRCTVFPVDRSGKNNAIFQVGSNQHASLDDTIPNDVDAGDEVCYGLVIRGYSHTTVNKSATRYSALQCAIVGKKPHVQIHGGSLQVGRSFAVGAPQEAKSAGVDTSTTTISKDNKPHVFGSWSEYGIYAPAGIRGMASNAGLNPDNTSKLQSAWSQLTFTALPSSHFGGYESRNTSLPNIEAAFPLTSTTPDIGSSTTPHAMAGSVGRVVTGKGGITVKGGSLGNSRWAVLNAPTAHVTITGNITRSGTYSNVHQIPQLIIIANNITIDSSVERIDAWLIARTNTTGGGSLATCNQRGNAYKLGQNGYYQSSAARLTSNDCKRRLTVNGPVIANKLFLRRTFGAESQEPGKPAEVFNFRPDAYLWAYDRTTNTSIYKTTNVREVPPRY